MSRRQAKKLVVIAVPILRVSARVVIEKGRGWSAIDELVLWALSQEALSAGALSDEISLPRRVVLEVIVRMMRFRLVEVVLKDQSTAFRATAYGAGIVLGGEEIPALRKRISRKVSFVVDQITGTVFAKRDVRVENSSGLESFRESGADVRLVNVTGAQSLRTNPTENVKRFQEVLHSDEALLHFDGDTLIERDNEFMIISVDGSELRGMPERAPASLVSQIHRISRARAEGGLFTVSTQYRAELDLVLPNMIQCEFDLNRDIIIGGEAHRKSLFDIIGKANRRIIIHSTFINLGRFEALRESFRNAVRRGARIDFFWGAGSGELPGERGLAEANAISKAIAADDLLRNRLKIHLRSTGSHAKIILADNGVGGWVGVVGSCNWLWSHFDRFEMSVKTNDCGVIAEIIDRLGKLVLRPGFRPETGSELYLLSQRLRSLRPTLGTSSVGIVCGPMHEAILRKASGEGSVRFLVASDRLGNSAFANAIIPAEVFRTRTGLIPSVVYGQTAGAVVAPHVIEEIAHEAKRRDVRLICIEDGFHAKFMLWGNDDIVVTSLNWGSATASIDFPESEIGIHIHSAGIAEFVYAIVSDNWKLNNG